MVKREISLPEDRAQAPADVVAVVPAAGQSRRLGRLPCSKEILPIGFTTDSSTSKVRHQSGIECLIEQFTRAGVQKAYIVLRSGKWDIPAYLGDGKSFGLDVAYIVIAGSDGPPDSVNRAYPFVKQSVVAFGFPDILLQPGDVYCHLLTELAKGDCDVVLGLFPVRGESRSMDMVETDAVGFARSIVLKPEVTSLHYAWVCAVWTPHFTKYLQEFLMSASMQRRAGLGGETQIDAQGDIPVGAVFRLAVEDGLRVRTVSFSEGRYLDIGTPRALSQASAFYRASAPR